MHPQVVCQPQPVTWHTSFSMMKIAPWSHSSQSCPESGRKHRPYFLISLCAPHSNLVFPGLPLLGPRHHHHPVFVLCICCLRLVPVCKTFCITQQTTDSAIVADFFGRNTPDNKATVTRIRSKSFYQFPGPVTKGYCTLALPLLFSHHSARLNFH